MAMISAIDRLGAGDRGPAALEPADTRTSYLVTPDTPLVYRWLA